MPISNDKIEKISYEVIKILYKKFDDFPIDTSTNRNAPFHTAFLNAFSDKLGEKVADIPFFISLSSWLQGLNTTLGQTFFEKTAHILSDGEKREYTSRKLGNLKINQTQKNIINTIVTDLSSSNRSPNSEEEEKLLLQTDGSLEVNAIDFSADVFIEDADQIIAIELKSVRPNSGEMRGEKHKILEAKAALQKKFPNKKIFFFLGFPFDPTQSENPTGYDKNRFIKSNINLDKFFAKDEFLLADELWDRLSSQSSTMTKLLGIINQVATPSFLNDFRFLNKPENKFTDKAKYKKILNCWNLFSELKLVNNEELIKQIILNNPKHNRQFNQLIFNKDGEYNAGRFNYLDNLLPKNP